MNKQEFIQKESNRIHGLYRDSFSAGLSEGLETLTEFADWVTENLHRSYPIGIEEPVYVRNGINNLFQPQTRYTTPELLDIFLTQKYAEQPQQIENWPLKERDWPCPDETCLGEMIAKGYTQPNGITQFECTECGKTESYP